MVVFLVSYNHPPQCCSSHCRNLLCVFLSDSFVFARRKLVSRNTFNFHSFADHDFDHYCNRYLDSARSSHQRFSVSLFLFFFFKFCRIKSSFYDRSRFALLRPFRLFIVNWKHPCNISIISGSNYRTGAINIQDFNKFTGYTYRARESKLEPHK